MPAPTLGQGDAVMVNQQTTFSTKFFIEPFAQTLRTLKPSNIRRGTKSLKDINFEENNNIKRNK